MGASDSYSDSTPIWHNNNLRTGNKPFISKCWFECSIYTLKDLYNDYGLKSFQILKDEFSLPRFSFFLYLRLRSALKAYGVPWSIKISPHPMVQFKTLMLAYRTTTGSAPTYFHSLLRIYIPSRSLRSASEQRLVVPSERGSKSLSRTFSFTIPGWWNDLHTPIRNAGSLSIFTQQLKTQLFQHYLTSS